MRYKLTIGGKVGPKSREEFMDTMKAFLNIYGYEPTHLTVPPDGVRLIAALQGSQVEGDAILHCLLSDQPYMKGEKPWGEIPKFCGLSLTVGMKYTLGKE